jgi:ABC-type polysaccharide/polyol phosphate transport system ATPase subunit
MTIDKPFLAVPKIDRAPEARYTESLIEADGVSKKYCRDFRRSLWYAIQDMATGFLPGRDHIVLRREEFWAVSDVSFSLQRGESVGIIGHNGAGKSTLLKMLTGQRTLTKGRVVSRGRVVALTDLGLGFDPVLTGRENAYMNASVFGVSRRQLEKTIDAIIDFAGLREFIDAAVQTYSSGMKARLGFSVAAHLNPDILIVDEVLAVGDIHFRLKCVKHIQGYLQRGGSLLLVSHDPFLVQTICNRCIVLDKGRVIFNGSAVEGVNLHFQLGHDATLGSLGGSRCAAASSIDTGDGQSSQQNWLSEINEQPAGPAPQPSVFRGDPTLEHPVVVDGYFVTPVGSPSLVTGAPAIVTIRCRSLVEMEAGWAFNIRTSDLLTSITTCGTVWEHRGVKIRRGINEFRCRIPRLPLCPGVYGIRGGFVDLGTFSPIALLGYENKPDFFSVKAGQATMKSNAQSTMNDLVTMQVEWME